MTRETVKRAGRLGAGLLPVLTLLIVGAVVRDLPIEPAAVTHLDTRPAPLLLIDPGHGGEDGGAVAPDGTLEKDVNLRVAQKLSDMLTVLGYPVRMTRQDDRSLHDASADTLRRKKVSDMNNRLRLYNEAALVISIHQNMFGQSKYYGTQFFYSPNHPAGQSAATVLRETLYKLLQPDNTRELKRGDQNIFLLYKTTAPAVLVECGFLSNPEELARLKTEDYQRKLAYAIACGVMTYAP